MGNPNRRPAPAPKTIAQSATKIEVKAVTPPIVLEPARSPAVASDEEASGTSTLSTMTPTQRAALLDCDDIAVFRKDWTGNTLTIKVGIARQVSGFVQDNFIEDEGTRPYSISVGDLDQSAVEDLLQWMVMICKTKQDRIPPINISAKVIPLVIAATRLRIDFKLLGLYSRVKGRFFRAIIPAGVQLWHDADQAHCGLVQNVVQSSFEDFISSRSVSERCNGWKKAGELKHCRAQNMLEANLAATTRAVDLQTMWRELGSPDTLPFVNRAVKATAAALVEKHGLRAQSCPELQNDSLTHALRLRLLGCLVHGQ